MNTKFTHLDTLKSEIRSAVVVKYILIALTMLFLYLSKNSFPFPINKLFFVAYLAILLNTVILIFSFFKKFLIPLYYVTIYGDITILPAVLLYTGGFISPFIFQYVFILILCNLIFKNSTVMGWHIYGYIMICYTGVSLGQKFGLFENEVDFSRNLMKNSNFFYLIFFYYLCLVTFAHFVVLKFQSNVHARLKNMLFIQEKIMKGTVSLSKDSFFQTIVNQLADALHIQLSACGVIDKINDSINVVAACMNNNQIQTFSYPIAQSILTDKFSPGDDDVITGKFSKNEINHEICQCNITEGYYLANALKNNAGELIGILYVVDNNPIPEIDISQYLIKIFGSRASAELERRYIDEKNREIQEQLNQSQKMEALGQLAGGIAHDFNNILNGVMGYAFLLQKHLSDDISLMKYLDKIVELSQKASELINQLLSFSRKGKYIEMPVDFHLIIDDVINMLKHSLKKNVRIIKELSASHWFINGDAAQLENMLINLSINANDAMPDGGDLTFTTKIVAFDENDIKTYSHFKNFKPGNYLLLTLTDTGTGISKEISSKIFEPFFTTKPKGKGTGLGLASVYGCVENHNGWIDFKSEINKGTTFYLYFPINMNYQHNTLEKTKNSKIPITTHNATLLLVDDEQYVLDSISESLSLYGYTVKSFNNGIDAINYFEKNYQHIDVIILDLNMPVMNGFEVYSKLKLINSCINVIVATGYANEKETEALSKEKNILTIMKKPYIPEKLVEIIERIFNTDD